MFQKTWIFAAAIAMLEIALSSGAAQANTIDPTPIGPARIILFATGFNEDQVRVQLDAPFVPGTCVADDGYIVSPTDPGRGVHQAALLAAFLSGRPVTLTLDLADCVADRPRIIGVQMQ